MTEFSAVRAATEGLRLLRQKPGAVAAWGGAMLLFYVGFFTVFLLLGLGGGIAAMATAEGGEPNLAALGGGVIGMVIVMLLMLPASLFFYAVLNAAVIRAVLRPDERSIGYLRIGGDEWRIFLLMLIFFALYIGAVIVGGVLTAIFGMVHSALRILADLAFFAALVFFVVRLSLAMPLTFATRRVNAFGSWTLTRGRFWPLLGAYALTAVMCLGLMLVFFLIAAVLVGVFGASLFMGAGQGASPDPLGAMASLGALWVVLGIFYVGLAAVFIALTVSPPAAIYRDIAGARTAEVF